jgi:pimeloyl-ACP methyl ester carboxylesterase
MKGELEDLGNGVSIFTTPPFSKSVVLFIPGLGDGLFSLPFIEDFCSKLAFINFSFSQVIMRSSFNRFGQHLLDDDRKDIHEAVLHLVYLGFRRIFLMGHSTGCQDILYFLNKTRLDTSIIKGVILLGSVSDREAPTCPQNIAHYLAIDDPLFIVPGFNTLFRKERFISLFVKGGTEDMFSSDLKNFPRLEKLAIKTLILLGEDDESIPAQGDKEKLLQRWVRSNPTLITGKLVPGKHFIDYYTFFESYWPVVEKFINYHN